MDFIDLMFSKLSVLLQGYLPEGVLTNLLTEGIIPGIGGIVIFIPQIAILFAFISILEETGDSLSAQRPSNRCICNFIMRRVSVTWKLRVRLAVRIIMIVTLAVLGQGRDRGMRLTAGEDYTQEI